MEDKIITVSNVHGYIDESGTAWLNAEDIARGLGFVMVREDRVTTSGDKYEAVRWSRVNEYLSNFGYSQTVSATDFIPENMFYRLAMKAKNEAAEKFQAKVADEILPAIRKHGFYATEQTRDFTVHKIVLDVGRTSETLQQYFDVAKGIALATATSMVEKAFKIDLTPLKKLIPPEVSMLTPTEIGKQINLTPRKVNEKLIEQGLQIKIGKEYRLTDEGKKYAEIMPYTNNGHSGYQIKWTPQITTILTGADYERN